MYLKKLGTSIQPMLNNLLIYLKKQIDLLVRKHKYTLLKFTKRKINKMDNIQGIFFYRIVWYSKFKINVYY